MCEGYLLRRSKIANSLVNKNNKRERLDGYF